MIKKIFMGIATLLVAAVSVCLTAALLRTILFGAGISESRPVSEPVDMAVFDRFQMYMTNRISSALEGVLEIDKVYWLSDDDLVAPEPNQELFGKTDDPASLGWLLEDAQKLLNGQDTLFSTETTLAPGTQVDYYLDDTIFAVTWKQGFDGTMFTISEVKIAHPSQFRRFLAGGSYGSGIQLMTTQMAESVNAVVASSGDFYAFRRMGVVVYDGKVLRCNTKDVDTCYINDKGDLVFSYRGELSDAAAAQAFVDANNVRFSLAFGPVLVENGEKTDFSGYILGEVLGRYARAALCQLDELHYLLITSGREDSYQAAKTLREFQDVVASFGCKKAYALDGGQTAAIVMNDKLINRVAFGYQRDISDIIYFATAIPDGE